MSRYLYIYSDVKGPLLACLTARTRRHRGGADGSGRDRQPLIFVNLAESHIHR